MPGSPISQIVGEGVYFQEFREPAITAYNRLEGRPRVEDFTRSLRAEIRDALWMVTRQWQLGELTAEDAASPIDARLVTRHAAIDRISIGGQAPVPYDHGVPLEMVVEAEEFPWTLPMRIEAGQIFLRALPAGFPAAAIAQARVALALDAATDDEKRQADAVALRLVAGSRAIDGAKLLASHGDGSLATQLGVTGADAAAAAAAADKIAAWRQRIFGSPPEGPSPAWVPENLAYDVRVATAESGGEQAVLEARRYPGGRLDWYSFDAAAADQRLEDPDGAAAAAPEERPPLSFVPTAASFPGMPNPRFWEMEDRRVNFGSINAKTTDHVLLTFAELGLIYGNDWFVFPYELPVNHLCEVLGLVVTDVFGDRTIIPPANERDESAWEKWSLFTHSGDVADAWRGRYFWVPPSLSFVQEGEPIEEVLFGRDEMANLAWAIEAAVPDATGKGVETRLLLPEPPKPPEPADPSASARYTLGTTVPENWVPLLPVHLPGSIADVRFQRGQMPPTAAGAPSRRGVMLNEIPTPFYIAEEEVPVSGLTVSRRAQRSRWYGGRTCLWIGRARETGRGAAASHLRFDQIDDRLE